MLTGLARRGTLSGPAQPGKQKVEVVVEVEPRSNTLIVAGDEVTFEKVEQILTDLTAVPIERGLRIVPIANADASGVRERSLAIYNAQVDQIPGAGPVDITIDESTNSLEVVADAEAMDRYMDIIDELQRQIGPAREVRLIELRLAKAADVIAFLEEMTSASETLRIDGGPAPGVRGDRVEQLDHGRGAARAVPDHRPADPLAGQPAVGGPPAAADHPPAVDGRGEHRDDPAAELPEPPARGPAAQAGGYPGGRGDELADRERAPRGAPGDRADHRGPQRRAGVRQRGSGDPDLPAQGRAGGGAREDDRRDVPRAADAL
jgi:hypothetical protein